MRKFFTNITLGVVAFSALWGGVEIAIKKIYVRNPYSYKYRYVQNNAGIKTLLIGHSHFYNSINPYLLGDSVFNFAMEGRWIYYDAKLAQKIIPTLPNLKTVIFPIGYTTPYNSWHYKKFSELRDVDKNFAYNYAKYMDTYYDRFPWNIFMSSALLENRMGIKYWLDQEVDSLGYKEVDDFRETSHVPIPSDMLTSPTWRQCYDEYIGYLISIAKVCYDNNVRFITITCPCSNNYIKKTCSQGINNLYSIVDSISRYYPIEYRCYFLDDEFRADSIYHDSWHLNSIGADKLALRVKNDFDL